MYFNIFNKLILQPTSEQIALQMCSNAILNHPGLKPLIEAGVYDPADSIHNCVQDILVIKFYTVRKNKPLRHFQVDKTPIFSASYHEN
jgi:hypothetical protein